jgi:hypothetical protein
MAANAQTSINQNGMMFNTTTSGANNAGTGAITGAADIPHSVDGPQTPPVTAGVVPPTGTVPPVTTANTATSDNYQTQINQQLSQLSQPVDPNSAVVRGQTDAYHVASQRGLAANEGALAESAYAGGNTETGGYGEQQQQAREAASAAEGTNTGNVMATAEAQRKQEQENLLGLGTQAGLQQQGITNQAGQFGGQLGLNEQQLAQANSEFGTTSAQNQQSINNALENARAQTALGYHSVDTQATTAGNNTDLGYYNTQQNIASQQAQQQAAINAQLASNQASGT